MSLLATGAGAAEGLESYLLRMLRERQVDEQVRSNKANEGLQGRQIDETSEIRKAQQKANEAEAMRREDERLRVGARAARDDQRAALDDLVPGVMITPETRNKSVNTGAAAPERFSPRTVDFDDFSPEFVGPRPEEAKYTPESYTLEGQPTKPTADASIIQEYKFYEKQEIDAGRTPLSLYEYQQKKDKESGGSPYFSPVLTGTGGRSFNHRTGRLEDGPGTTFDLRPSASAEKDLTNAQSVLYKISEIEKDFNPAKVGPLMGRYKTMQLAMVGEQGEEGLAQLQTDVATLGNVVINLRTGAQMSEPEAQRILKEIPSMNLPPDVFMSRLTTARSYFQDWLRTRSRMAYGRTTPGDVDKMTGTGAGAQAEAPPTQGGGDLYEEYLRRTGGKP